MASLAVVGGQGKRGSDQPSTLGKGGKAEDGTPPRTDLERTVHRALEGVEEGEEEEDEWEDVDMEHSDDSQLDEDDDDVEIGEGGDSDSDDDDDDPPQQQRGRRLLPSANEKFFADL